MALCLARKDAVAKWRELLGPAEVEKAKEEAPETWEGHALGVVSNKMSHASHRLRAQFASMDNINALHGSSSEDEASKELGFFFPKEQTVAVIKPNAMENKGEYMGDF